MTYSARILADSISPHGHRLTTMEWQYPRFVHSEVMTHRVMSRNAASSRAIPAKVLRASITENPVIPLEWVTEQKLGMVGGEPLHGNDALVADALWLHARDVMIQVSDELSALGVHRSLPNRIVEPFMWITIIISATEWENLFHLRVARDVEQHFYKIATMAENLYRASTPRLITPGDPIPWHLPLIRQDDLEEWAVATLSVEDLRRISVGRCARVSYLTHDGRRDPRADIDLCDRLEASRHLSPFEHVATPVPESMCFDDRKVEGFLAFAGMRHHKAFRQHLNSYGNLEGWISSRYFIPGESGRDHQTQSAEGAQP